MKYLVLFTIALWLTTAPAAELPAIDFDGNFDPVKPTIRMEYKVSYRLLKMELKHLSIARVEATEGYWLNETTGEYVPACIADFHLDTSDRESETPQGRLSLHNRITAILTYPELEPLVYVKNANEHVDFFCKKRTKRNVEVFNLESGTLDYIKHDYITGATATSLTGSDTLTRQGKEVLRFMKVLSGFYAGDQARSSNTNDMKVWIYTDNAMVPFNITTKPDRRTINVLGMRISVMSLRAEPDRNANGRGRSFAMWAASFKDVSARCKDDTLIWVANHTFEWSMVPLITEFGLSLGSVRCVMTSISASGDAVPATVKSNAITSVMQQAASSDSSDPFN